MVWNEEHLRASASEKLVLPGAKFWSVRSDDIVAVVVAFAARVTSNGANRVPLVAD